MAHGPNATDEIFGGRLDVRNKFSCRQDAGKL